MRNRSRFGWIELIEGILLIILGIFSFLRPDSMLSGFVMFFGLIALCIGILDIIFYALMSGCLSVLAGLMLLVYPSAVKWAFSLFFPMWFIAHCISRLSQLPMIRIWTVKWHYYFIMIANIVGLFLGIFMLIRPVAALISLSYLIGIDLILLGIDSIILAFSRMGSDWDSHTFYNGVCNLFCGLFFLILLPL